MDAFDADVLIYAAQPDHPLGPRIRLALGAASWPAQRQASEAQRIGSVLLLPELLSKPQREQHLSELQELTDLLARLDLQPLDMGTATLASTLGATYRLHAPDAVHLATAVAAGADRFITNNHRDFPRTITEVAVVYPDDLPDPNG